MYTTMNKDIAVFLAYGMAEALNAALFRQRLLHFYGTDGVAHMVTGCRLLAREWEFEAPVFENWLLRAIAHIPSCYDPSLDDMIPDFDPDISRYRK